MLKQVARLLLEIYMGVRGMGKWKGLPHEPIHHCHAKSKQTGKRCRQFAVKGKQVCYYHGARSLSGSQSPRIKHGMYTKKSIALRKRIARLARASNQIIRDMEHNKC